MKITKVNELIRELEHGHTVRHGQNFCFKGKSPGRYEYAFTPYTGETEWFPTASHAIEWLLSF